MYNDRTLGLTQFLERSATRRLVLVKQTIVLGLLAALLSAPGLWLLRPPFTPVPVWDGPTALPAPWDTVVLALLVALLLAIACVRSCRVLVLVWCALFTARTAWDQVTWQPYLLQYLLMLLPVAFVGWRDAGARSARSEAVLNIHRAILIGIYFWSGIHKAHAQYLLEGGSFFMRPHLEGLPEGLRVAIASLVPLAETTLALCLVSRRWREIGVLGLIAMHVLILIMLGPLGAGYNAVVWPWNIVMIAMLLLLFWGDAGTSPGDVLWGRSARSQRPVPRAALRCHAVVLVVVGLCPLLSHIGAWSPYLSFRLYARRDHQGYILLTRPAIERLPADVRRAVEPFGSRGFSGYLSIPLWFEAQVGALPPPVPPVYKTIARRFMDSFGVGDAELLIEDPPGLWTGERQRHVYSRADL